jgi:hypothetical protein
MVARVAGPRYGSPAGKAGLSTSPTGWETIPVSRVDWTAEQFLNYKKIKDNGPKE